MRHAIDYTGVRVGKLTILERAENKVDASGSVIQWKCICECGEIVYRRSYHIKRGRCKCKKCKALEEAEKYGYNDIRQHHWYNIKKLAGKRKLAFELSMEYAWDLYESQNRKCALSGLPIIFAKTKKDHATGGTTASLDRIDSSKGYVKDNVQWLHKWVNLMKSDFEQDEFINFCKLIVEENEKTKNT